MWAYEYIHDIVRGSREGGERGEEREKEGEGELRWEEGREGLGGRERGGRCGCAPATPSVVCDMAVSIFTQSRTH